MNVTPGLYLLRYVSSSQPREAPSAVLRAAGSSKESIAILSAPGRVEGELPAPGSCAVVAVYEPTAVEVEITAVAGSNNLDAKFSLDLLDAGETDRSQRPHRVSERSSRQQTSSHAVKIAEAVTKGDVSCDLMAHVARRGDVLPDQENWIAGPRAPSALEGFAITCRGADVGVSAQITTARGRGIWSEWHDPGAFVGSRQQANAITGIRLRLVGADATHYSLDCRALFLGAPVAERRGAEVEFSSFGTSDPLVGLAVKVVSSGQVSDRIAVSNSTPRRTASRVRVFR